MKFLFDLFPVLLFFAAYQIPRDPMDAILLATGVAILASLAQVGWMRLRRGRYENMHLVTLALIIVLGGATLLLQDERFIKWKPTAVNWAFALAFLASQYIGRRNLVERMLGTTLTLPPEAWGRLNASWVAFFAVVGAANLAVAYNFNTEIWVNFKLFGILGLTLLFVVGQSFYLMRHLEPDNDTGEP